MSNPEPGTKRKLNPKERRDLGMRAARLKNDGYSWEAIRRLTGISERTVYLYCEEFNIQIKKKS